MSPSRRNRFSEHLDDDSLDPNIDPLLQSHRYHPYGSNFASGSRSQLGIRPPSSSADSLGPSDSISAAGGLSSRQSPAPSSRPPSRVGSIAGSIPLRRHASSPAVPMTISDILSTRPSPWTPERKKLFENRLMRMTASAGFPLGWMENPEWKLFCDEFIPGAPSISRKVLTNRILTSVVDNFRVKVKEELKGQEATLQSDGWSGVNNHHLVAFMITANKQVQMVEVRNTTKERKKAELYLEDIEEVYMKLMDDWKVNVVGLVTDASGEARKARRLFANIHPSVVVLDCYAHQVNLIVGDYFRSKSDSLWYTETASQLISWLRSKSRILSHLPLAVLRAVITRWTAHYASYRRLLLLYPHLKSLALNDLSLSDDDKVLISGDAAAKRKGREMVKIINDSSFWHSIALVARFLEPLAVAANIIQSAFCRLDQVLLTFGSLVMQYNDPIMSADDRNACNAIISSIESRWSKCDQEVFVCALLLNPFYRTSPFADNKGGVVAEDLGALKQPKDSKAARKAEEALHIGGIE